MSRSVLLLSLLGVAASSALGCVVFRSLAGKNTLDLQGADVRSMGVDIRKQEKTICPRERVQMAVFADVVLKGEGQVRKVETWHGTESQNGKLDFSDFAFQSAEGQFDQTGWFSPNSDLVKTANKEFEIKTVYRRRPDKFSFTTTYKPDYRCIHEAGEAGQPGSEGQNGQAGTNGESGGSGSSTSAGGRGGDGRAGGNGGGGGQGSAGPRITAYVTFVKTAFYPKLIAVRIEGSGTDFIMAHPEGSLVLVATGGDGGRGGDGGSGGNGGPGGSGNPGGTGGTGGPGGSGGTGGNGGPGGSIELVLDERFPELAGLVKASVSGGTGGAAGRGGGAGNAGSAGSAFGNGVYGSSGSSGTAGPDGAGGSPGPAGQSAERKAAVVDRFSGYTGITVLES